MARRRKPTGSPGYIPPKERREAVNKAADKQLDRFIKNKYESTKNQDAGIASIVQDMPKKFADNFINSRGEIGPEELGKKSRYYRADGSLNSAGLATLSQYTDERPEYSRQMNRLVNSSPQLKEAYARRFPISNFAMNVMPRFLPVVGPAFTADQVMKNKRLEQNYLNRPESDYNKYVEYFKPQMNSEQIANTEIIEGEKEPLISPQDMNIQRAVNPSFASPQDMGFLDDENIFDTEKAAIDAALTPGNVFDPVAADKQSKVDFINQVENTDFTVQDAELRFNIDEQFEKSKQKQGMIIRDEVDINQQEDVEDPIPGGQFNLTSPTVNEDTVPVILGGAGPDYDYGDFMVNEDLGNVIPTDNMFPEGGVSGNFVDNMGSGTEMIGDSMFANEPGSQSAFDTLNSNATSGFTGRPKLRYNFADGGSTNKYENMSTHEKLMRMAAEMYG